MTIVGSEASIAEVVVDLIYLERDALSAYDSTLEKLENADVRSRIEEYRDDHRRCLSGLQSIADELHIRAPAEGDMKPMLTTGGVGLANMIGSDADVLRAMKVNEDDALIAYQAAERHADADADSKRFFAKAKDDERRHGAWMEETAQQLMA